MTPDWLEIRSGTAPLVIAFPHTGTEIPQEIEQGMASPWLARKDADWWVEKLYAFAAEFGASMVRTRISRSVIDVNRDPSGASLYPGQATTGLCPTTTFDGEALYLPGKEPDEAEIARRRETYFAPYHGALRDELDRQVTAHGRVVLFDAHSIRSTIPRLFEGELPIFNIGTNHGATCAPSLQSEIERIARASGMPWVANGRFVGGWTTRHYGQPARKIHAVQMELACRGYLAEPVEASPETWPAAFEPSRAAPLQAVLRQILLACVRLETFQ